MGAKTHKKHTRVPTFLTLSTILATLTSERPLMLVRNREVDMMMEERV